MPPSVSGSRLAVCRMSSSPLTAILRPPLQRSAAPLRNNPGPMCDLLFQSVLFITCLAVGILADEASAEDKWVWSGSGRSSKLSKGVNGRYGVFEEPELPDEPYSPLVRPPPSNLPPLVRPSDRPYDVRPSPGLGSYYSGRPGVVGSDRLPPAGGLDRPYDRPFNPGFNNGRPYDRAPINSGFNNGRYPSQNPSFRPPPPPLPSKPGLIDLENNDPTKFDKCKCTHSFNCKSPGIVFGSCDAGKKYCCEKRIHHSNGIPANDGAYPEVLAGPGGPVDHLIKPQAQYPIRENIGVYGRIEPRRP